MSDDGLTWIKHDGGPMPVPGDTMVLVEWGDGTKENLDQDGTSRASYWDWETHFQPSSTIVGYAIVTPSQTAPTLTGGSSPYYTIDVNGTTIECNDIIKALGLPYADGNVLKAVWRIAMDRMGKGKPGNTRLYDAEKIVFFGNDIVGRERGA